MTHYKLEVLSESHDVSSFCCGGETSLDKFLANEALVANQRGLSRTHVWLEGDKVVAYFTVIPLTVAPSVLPKSARRGATGGIPGFEIGKLALDKSLRGKGLGPDLLVDAIRAIIAAADQVGGRVITVTAVDNPAWKFYRNAGFEEVDASYDLWMFVDTARASMPSK